jgi:hypothetical protein
MRVLLLSLLVLATAAPARAQAPSAPTRARAASRPAEPPAVVLARADEALAAKRIDEAARQRHHRAGHDSWAERPVGHGLPDP